MYSKLQEPETPTPIDWDIPMQLVVSDHLDVVALTTAIHKPDFFTGIVLKSKRCSETERMDDSLPKSLFSLATTPITITFSNTPL